MEVLTVLRMNGGIGENSYANNSTVQKKVINMTRPITEHAITSLYSAASPATLAIADLGCSSGPNTLFTVSEIIVKAVQSFCAMTGHQSPEYQIYLNDLPSNDFNSIFVSLPIFQTTQLNQQGIKEGTLPKCFFTGVPGSFYGRLFPRNSLHFVHSSYSLQWLSKVPEGVQNNKGNVYISRKSPPNVVEAYYKQFREDFKTFLECRAEELVSGGRMVLTFLGRRSDDPCSDECCCIWELLAMALYEMVSEGLMEEEKLDNFNIPLYNPCPGEVKLEIENQGAFSIDDLAVSEVNWSGYDTEVDPEEASGSYSVAGCMRAVAEPLLLNHFGGEIIEDCFERYRKLIAHRMAKEKPKFVNVIVSLVRK
ncbi:hypothetical protein MLD38_007275 [Melastoma candidum]|uniref:Uncharacterized protein n=1 Tax=Melastoma candidum TaxID=119954 RepID=A0ACB9RZ41_9MYRT|nr:hypothetical protein MLD38_007275 [Melastoma candidum]